jgi:Tfp pilus assembly protein PilP
MRKASISPLNVTVALSATIVVSVFLAIFLWFWTDVEAVRIPHLSIEDLPSAQTYSTSDIEAVLARPLFWQGREPIPRPEEPVDKVEDKMALPLEGIKLLGIILTGDVRMALLEVGGKVMTAKAGQVIQNWKVEKVTAKEIVFVAGAEQTVLSLVHERPDSIQLKMAQ